MSALASVKDDESQSRIDNLQRQWLEEHARKIKELAGTLFQMIIAPRIVWRGHKGTNRARRILKFNPKRVSPMGSSRHAGEKEADRKLVDQFWSDATDER